MLKILLTSTSFQDTPGKHHDLLKNKKIIIEKFRGPLTADQLLPIIDNFDGVICGDDEYNFEVLNKGSNSRLKVISKYGIGLDKIDLNAAKDFKIKIYNTPGVNHQAVAEHAFALLLSYEKNIIREHLITKAGKWKRLIGHEIFKKKAGILGLGNVGKNIAVKAKAFGMDVYAYDLNKDEEFNSKYDINFCETLDEFIHEVDYLFLSLPLSKSTKNIINSTVFYLMKENIVIINTARADLLDQKVLVKFLTNNKIRAYLTDVLEIEPMIKNHPLNNFKNVIITPHIGSRNYETVERQGVRAVNNLFNFFKI